MKLLLLLFGFTRSSNDKFLASSNHGLVICHQISPALMVRFDFNLSKIHEFLSKLTRLNLVFDGDLGAARPHDLPQLLDLLLSFALLLKTHLGIGRNTSVLALFY